MILAYEQNKGIGLFIPPLHEIIISGICLIIIFIIVIKFAVPKFYKILDKREKNIFQKVNDANKIMTDAKIQKEINEKEYTKIMDDSQKTYKESHEKAQNLLKETEDKAHIEYSKIVENAKVKIEKDEKESKIEVEKYAKTKAVILAKKMLHSALSDKKVADKIFDNMISEK